MTDEAAQLREAGATEGFVQGTGHQAPVADLLLQCMRDIGYIQKGARNDFHKYKYLSEEQVKRAVQKALTEAGVMPTSITFPEERMRFWEYERKSKSYLRVMMVCVIQFADGSRYEGLGMGEDPEDKAIMKAQTAAIRECWKNIFCIPAGNDPEETPKDDGEAKPKQPAKGKPAAKKDAGPSDEQLAALKKAREALGLSSKDAAAIVHHLFDARFMDLSGEQIDKLDELLVNMNKATAEAVKGGDLSGVKVPS